MRLLVTTNARLYKGPNGLYYTPLVYGYSFFQRYLHVFEEIRLVAHTEPCSEEKTNSMLLVSGLGVKVFEMPFPHGKIAYIKSAYIIGRKAKECIIGCDAALFRVPDPLAFQIFPKAKRAHIPIAIEVTSDPLELYSSTGGRYPLRLLIRWSHYWALRIICKKAEGVSYVTKSYLQSVYPSGIKSTDNHRFETHYTTASIIEHDSPKRHYPLSNQIRLLHVSASIIGKIKGHKELIEAFIALRNQGFDVNLTLAGAGKLDDDITSILERSGYKKYVTFTGIVGMDKLTQLYRDSDIFVFPSYREGLPRVVIEAMSWGLPCVCSDIPGHRELLPSRVLVPVKDSVALTDKLKELLTKSDCLYKESLLNANESHQYVSSNVNKQRNKFYLNLRQLSKGTPTV